MENTCWVEAYEGFLLKVCVWEGEAVLYIVSLFHLKEAPEGNWPDIPGSQSKKMEGAWLSDVNFELPN